jgi:WD40 repeat protein/class 3 adenylate cyclase
VILPEERGRALANTGPTTTLAFVIADVRGYTRFTRERGDAAAALLAKKFADLARDAVEARSGRVIELRGDEALAVFTAPAQAVRAAIEFQATCSEESQADPMFPLPVGIGIDVGEAVPVEDGYRGVALNMAARLCSNAAAGQVLVTRAIVERAAAIDGQIRFEERGPASFKGFEEPVDVIEAIADDAAVVEPASEELEATLPPELDPLTPLVEREHELRWLRGTWRQTCRGRGRVLFVSGPAQIGKTRLAAEIARHVSDRGGSVRYAGPGGAATAVALATLREGLQAGAPTLVVLDDVDVAGPPVAEAIDASFEELAGGPVLVLALLRDLAAGPALAAVIERADAHGDGHRVLAPLDLEGVRGIVEMYVGAEAAAVPVEAMARASGGVPGRVHEVVSDWARTEAARRLEAAAEFLASNRERHAGDLRFANNVIGLQLGRLFTVEGRDVLAVETCPYKGLAPFEEDDAAYFFGRERLVGELAARTVQVGLLGVVGASGSGKSSVVAAGLLPSLRAGLLPGSDRWTQATMRPGEHPMQELRRALNRDGANDDPLAAAIENEDAGRLVLVVDQFEETFTTCASEDERAAFIETLVRAAKRDPERVAIVLTIRGDYYAHCAPYPELAEALANHVLVGPLTREELKRAVELPARRAGLRVETALVDALVEEVADEPGGLPLLSTALVELWQVREGGWIRMEAYERTGGVHGAVTRLAEFSYAELTDAEREAAHRVFLRLVAVGEGEATTKRRVDLDEFDLERDRAAATVITKLTQDRLLTMGDGTVEVAHEALLREWPRLQAWLEEDAQGRQLRQHLTQAAKQWEARGREPSELYRGVRLSAALDWSAGHSVELNELEREFLASSGSAAQQEAERQRRTNRRLRGLLVGTAVFLVVALVAGALALVQRGSARRSAQTAQQEARRADRAADRAKASAVAAESQRLSAESLLQQSPDLSLLLARQAVELNDTQQSRASLMNTLLRWNSVLRVIRPNGNRLLRLAVAGDGSWVAFSDNTNSVVVYDRHPFRQRFTVHRFADELASSPDGRTLFVATADAPEKPEAIEAYDARTGQRLWRTTASSNGLSGLAVSPDGRVVAAADAPFTDSGSGPQPAGKGRKLSLMHASDGSLVADPIRIDTFGGVSFAGNDRVVVSDDTTARFLAVPSGRVTRTVHIGRHGFVTVSPDGSTLAIQRTTGDIELRNLATGDRRVLRAPAILQPLAVRFTPDGSTIAEGTEDGTVVAWNVASGEATTFRGHTGAAQGLGFTPDGRTMYTDGLDSTAIEWDVAGDRGVKKSFDADYPPNPEGLFPYFSWSPHGRTIAMIDIDHRMRFLDARTFQRVGMLPKDSFSCCMPPAFDASGKRLAVAALDGVDLWDVPSRSLIRRVYTSKQKVPAHGPPPVDTAALSRDGTTVVTNEASDVLIVDTQTGDVRQRLDAGEYVEAVALSPDARTVVASTDTPGLVAWDAESGRELWRFKTPDVSTLPAFSNDSRMVATGAFNGKVYVFDSRSGDPIGKPFTGQNGFVWLVSFQKGTELIASTGTQGDVHITDPQTGKSIGITLTGTEGWATGQWSPTGTQLALLAADGHAFLWDMSPTAWNSRACDIAGRTLTRQEWQEFLPDRPYAPAC